MDEHSDANNGIIVHKSLKEADRNELVDEFKDKLITDAATGDTDPSVFNNGSQDVVNHNVENDEHLYINQDSNKNPSVENKTSQQAIGTQSNAEVSNDLDNSNSLKVGEIIENNKNSLIEIDITANEESSTSRNPSIDSSTSAREVNPSGLRYEIVDLRIVTVTFVLVNLVICKPFKQNFREFTTSNG